MAYICPTWKYAIVTHLLKLPTEQFCMQFVKPDSDIGLRNGMWLLKFLMCATELLRTLIQVILNHWNEIIHGIWQEAMQGKRLTQMCSMIPAVFFLDAWMARIRLLSAMWTPILLEPSCHDGPTPTRPQAAPLSLLWSCSMWSLQYGSDLHSCNGFRIWCACLWSVPLRTQRHGVSTTVFGLLVIPSIL